MKFNCIISVLGIISLVMIVITGNVVFEKKPAPVIDNIGYTIVIDAGHGGIDAGVVGNRTGIKESDLNLWVAELVFKRLTESGFNAVMTRTTQDGLYGTTEKGFKRRDMEARKKIIVESKPDLVISVHMNFYTSSYRKGPQVFFQKSDSDGQKFAELMQKALNKKTQTNGRFLSGDFYICRESGVPAVIVECGFLSNEQDELLLSKAEYRENLSEAIVEGAMLYLFERNGSSQQTGS